MSRLPFSLFKQGTNEYEVKDTEARTDIDTLKSALTWKELGNASPNNSITLPTDYNELEICIGGTDSTSAYSVTTMRITKAEIDTFGGDCWIVINGGYLSDTFNAYANVKYIKNSNSILFNTWHINNAVATNSVMYIRYR